MDLGLLMQGGSIPSLPPNATREQQIAALNDIIARLNEQLRSQTFSDGTSKRYVNGFAPGRFPGGDFGMAISQPGDDVLTIEFGKLLFAWDYTNNTQYWFNKAGTNYYQLGTLPDNSDGFYLAKPGVDVRDSFS